MNGAASRAASQNSSPGTPRLRLLGVSGHGSPAFAEATEGIGAAHQWFWDGHEHVDPAKDATAQAKRLASGTTTLAEEYAKCGKDWQTELRQRAREVKLARELGLGEAEAAPAASR